MTDIPEARLQLAVAKQAIQRAENHLTATPPPPPPDPEPEPEPEPPTTATAGDTVPTPHFPTNPSINAMGNDVGMVPAGGIGPINLLAWARGLNWGGAKRIPAYSINAPGRGPVQTDLLVRGMSHDHTYWGILPEDDPMGDIYTGDNHLYNGWDLPEAHTHRTRKEIGDTIHQHAPLVWWPTIYDRRTGKISALQEVPVYYVAHESLGHTRDRRMHLVPNGGGYVSFQHQFTTSSGLEPRLHLFGPVAFHADLPLGRIDSPRAQDEHLWFQGDGPIPPESEGWFQTPQLQVYLKVRGFKDGDDLRANASFGGPDTDIEPHVDYVSSTTALAMPDGDVGTTLGQAIIDHAFNHLDGWGKIEGARFR